MTDDAGIMVEQDRLKALIDYVEATERDRLRTVLDMADYRGFRRAGDEVVLLPGVLVDVRDGDDHRWLSVERLVRCPPPVPDDAELRTWLVLTDDTAAPPALRPEVPRASVVDVPVAEASPVEAEPDAAPTDETREPDEAGPDKAAQDAILRLADHPGRARIEAALEGYTREIWSAWALEERPRRRAIDLYNALFAVRQTLDGGGEQPVELVWGIGVARWTRPAGRLHHPLLTVPVELTLDEATHRIDMRPRSEAPPGIESAPLDALEAPSVDAWQAAAQRHLDALEVGGESEGLSPFDAESFAPILRRAVALFDPDGQYLPDLGALEGSGRRAPSGDALQVDGGWVLIERSRRATQLMDDLRRFRTGVDGLADTAELPAAVRVLLQPPADTTQTPSYPAFRGVSTVPGVTSSDGSGADLFFPLPPIYPRKIPAAY